MSTEFHVDLDHLDQVVARLTGLAEFITDHLLELDKRVADLPSGSWDSTTAHTYIAVHNECATGAREFAKGVAEMSSAAKRAHGGYTTAFETNKRMLRGG